MDMWYNTLRLTNFLSFIANTNKFKIKNKYRTLLSFDPLSKTKELKNNEIDLITLLSV